MVRIKASRVRAHHPVFQLLSHRALCLLVLLGPAFFATVVIVSHNVLDTMRQDDDVAQFLENQHRRGVHHHRPERSENEISFKQQSERAVHLKELYEQDYPPDDVSRIKSFVEGLRRPHEYQTQEELPYDIYNCPPTPPPGYPMAWNVLNVIDNWNPGHTTEPARLHQSLCVFDYETDLSSAEAYRKAELPFLIRNTPEILKTAERWNRDSDYLSKILQGHSEKVEHSHNQHFMYYKIIRRLPPGWTPPMEETKLTFDEWSEKAKLVTTDEPQQERFYFRLNGVKDGPHNFLYDELPIFLAKPNNFFMVEPEEERGINCRFGMKGVIAETHYDQSRNFIVLMGGQRRYVMAHPRECPNLGLYPQGHPSGRHSAIDWTNPDLTKFPRFAKAQVHEVVLQAGDALYLPTFWFHFIVSLNVNYQCNARSGMTYEHAGLIQQCGF